MDSIGPMHAPVLRQHGHENAVAYLLDMSYRIRVNNFEEPALQTLIKDDALVCPALRHSDVYE
eukprot:357281-Chlamydomonas_euryale.AAC.13